MENQQPPPNEKDASAEKLVSTKSTTADDNFLSYPVQLQNDEVSEDFEKTRSEVEKKFSELLMSISEETLQLSEFLIEEKKLIQDMCLFLREILKNLNINLDIPAKAFSGSIERVKKATLNNEAHLLILYDDGNVSSNTLENYPPQVILSVVWNIMPKLEKHLRTYRRKISERVNIFEKVRKELKNIKQVLSSSISSQEDVFVIGNEELRTPVSESEQQNTSSQT
ncbi:MAG: hypothetical protein QXJ02_03560 [Candidatus Bathyarchaeia archaeon]